MSLLCSIIQKLINANFFIDVNSCTNMQYWEEVYANNKNFNVLEPNFFLYFYCSNLMYSDSKYKTFIEKKFFYLHEHLNNMFISKKCYEDFLSVFQKAQCTYYAFSKLARIYKYKKTPTKINVDMYLNEIKETNKIVIPIIHNNSKYLFVGSDLIKIINSALLNSSYFFAEPLQPKNPFNNLPFDNVALYNIYFHIKDNCSQFPILLHLFFKTNFIIEKFVYENECILRDNIITHHVKNSPPTILYHDLKNMISLYQSSSRRKININDEIPKDKLIDIFRPYLLLYFTVRYGVEGTEKKTRSLYDLKRRLNMFANFNPKFGRKYYKFEKKTTVVICPFTNKTRFVTKRIRTDLFNLDHIDFYKNANVKNRYDIADLILNTRIRGLSFEHDGSEEDDESEEYSDDDASITEVDTVISEEPMEHQIADVENIPDEDLENVVVN